jgi:elongation factor G
MQTRLGATPIAIQMPMFSPRAPGVGSTRTATASAASSMFSGSFGGVVDLITMRARTWDEASFGAKFVDGPIPHVRIAAASKAREQMLEALAELDDELMAAWVAGKELPPDLVKAALRRVTLHSRGVPVLVGAAFRNQGIHNLLDAVVDFLPSPGPVRGRDPEDPAGAASIVRPPTAEAPLAALAFKIQPTTSETSQLTFVRVYAGTLRAGDAVLDATRGHLEHVGKLVRMFANHREDIAAIEPGMIGAIVSDATSSKLGTGDTLCDPRSPILLDTMVVPAPVMGLVIEPETDADHERIHRALERLAKEDPSFRVATDAESGQIIIHGMGELHLEIVTDRLRREHHVNARIGSPRVAFRETVTQRADGDHKLARPAQSLGGRGEYGHVTLVVEPLARGGGFVYENRAAESAIPAEFVSAVAAGIAEAVERGVSSGHPMTDLRVQVTGGSFHPVDSNNYAFKTAALKAFLAAVGAAHPTMLEPVMALEVVTPDEHVGEVLGDLHARRGKVTGIAARTGVQTVACFVPMASMFGYATDLRSRTKGRATYSMELDHYAELPQQLRDDLMSRPEL